MIPGIQAHNPNTLNDSTSKRTVAEFDTWFRNKYGDTILPGLTGSELAYYADREMYSNQLLPMLHDFNMGGNSNSKPKISTSLVKEDAGFINGSKYTQDDWRSDPEEVKQHKQDILDESWTQAIWDEAIRPLFNLIPGHADQPEGTANPVHVYGHKFREMINFAPEFGIAELANILDVGAHMQGMQGMAEGYTKALGGGIPGAYTPGIMPQGAEQALTQGAEYDPENDPYNDLKELVQDNDKLNETLYMLRHKAYEWYNDSEAERKAREARDPAIQAYNKWVESEPATAKNFWHPHMITRGFTEVAPSVTLAVLPGVALRVGAGLVGRQAAGMQVAGMIQGGKIGTAMETIGGATYSVTNAMSTLSGYMSIPMIMAMEGGSEFQESMYYLTKDPEGPQLPPQKAVPIAGTVSTAYSFMSGSAEKFQLGIFAKYLGMEKQAKKSFLTALSRRLFMNSEKYGGWEKFLQKAGTGGQLLTDNFIEAGVESTQTVMQLITNEALRNGIAQHPDRALELLAKQVWETNYREMYFENPEVTQTFWQSFAGMAPMTVGSHYAGKSLSNDEMFKDLLMDGHKISVEQKGNNVKVLVNEEVITDLDFDSPGQAQGFKKDLDQGLNDNAPQFSQPFKDFNIQDIETPEQMAHALSVTLWKGKHSEDGKAHSQAGKPMISYWHSLRRGNMPDTTPRENDSPEEAARKITQGVLIQAKSNPANVRQWLAKLIQGIGRIDKKRAANLINNLEIPESLKIEIAQDIASHSKGEKKARIGGEGDGTKSSTEILDDVPDQAYIDDLADPDSNALDSDVDVALREAGFEFTLGEANSSRQDYNTDVLNEPEMDDPDFAQKNSEEKQFERDVRNAQSNLAAQITAMNLDVNTLKDEKLAQALMRMVAIGLDSQTVLSALSGRKADPSKGIEAKAKLSNTKLNKLQKSLGLGFSKQDISTNRPKVENAVVAEIEKQAAKGIVEPVVEDTPAPVVDSKTVEGFVKANKKVLDEVLKTKKDSLIDGSIAAILPQDASYGVDEVRAQLGLKETVPQESPVEEAPSAPAIPEQDIAAIMAAQQQGVAAELADEFGDNFDVPVDDSNLGDDLEDSDLEGLSPEVLKKMNELDSEDLTIGSSESASEIASGLNDKVQDELGDC